MRFDKQKKWAITELMEKYLEKGYRIPGFLMSGAKGCFVEFVRPYGTHSRRHHRIYLLENKIKVEHHIDHLDPEANWFNVNDHFWTEVVLLPIKRFFTRDKKKKLGYNKTKYFELKRSKGYEKEAKDMIKDLKGKLYIAKYK